MVAGGWGGGDTPNTGPLVVVLLVRFSAQRGGHTLATGEWEGPSFLHVAIRMQQKNIPGRTSMGDGLSCLACVHTCQGCLLVFVMYLVDNVGVIVRACICCTTPSLLPPQAHHRPADVSDRLGC